MNRSADDEVSATVTQFLDQPLNLFDAVQFCTHGHGKGESRVQAGQQRRQVSTGEKVQKQVRRSGPTIDNDQIGFIQGLDHRVKSARTGQVEETRLGMKPLERRVFVVAVESRVRELPVFEVLDEIDGEETFAHAALAVEDEDELLFHILGSSMNSTLATRGPGVRGVGVGGKGLR